MPKLLVSSDLHLNCRGVLRGGWGGRPCDSVPEHTEWVTGIINAHASPADTLVLIGDHAFAKNAVEQAFILRELLKTVRCNNVVLLNGNHDFRDAVRCLGREPRDTLSLARNGIKFFFCHYPMLTWPGSHRGSICCYGHTHSAFEEEFDRLIPQRRALDVGLDNAHRILGEYRPFDVMEVVGLLKDRTGSFLASSPAYKKWPDKKE